MARMSAKSVCAAIERRIRDGTLRKGYPMPPVVDMAARLACDEAAVERAYADLYARDVISGIGLKAGRMHYFAGPWSEINDPSFPASDELARMTGKLFSYRAEEPDEPLLLKVTHDASQRTSIARSHRHDFHELVVVTRGAGLHVHGRERYPVHGGDCFVVMPGEGHGFVSEGGMEVTNVIFYSELLAPHFELFREIPGFLLFFSVEPLFRKESSFRHKLHLSVAQRKEALRMADNICRERREQQPGSRIAALTQFYELVVFVSRLYGAVDRQREQVRELAGKEQVISRVIAHLQEHSTEDLSVGDVARHVFLSTSRLQHIFRDTLGVSFSEYLLSVRIEHACALLTESNAPISHTAAQVGFHDRGYFSRMFKRKTGMSPARYRETHRPARESGDRPDAPE
ncbi:MAG: helix-turn-helix domain-containing protein [Chitinivibrionales bacterium]|nr:helix-turn-helix domain-containing protein [Chitinivibrionales bacterium]